MTDKIWVGTIYEAVSGEFNYRCDLNKIGINDIMYIRKDISDKRITELEQRLEINKEHDYDGIDCRDETIKQLERQNAELVLGKRQLNELIDSQLQTIEALKLRLEGLSDKLIYSNGQVEIGSHPTTYIPPSAADYEAGD